MARLLVAALSVVACGHPVGRAGAPPADAESYAVYDAVLASERGGLASEGLAAEPRIAVAAVTQPYDAAHDSIFAYPPAGRPVADAALMRSETWLAFEAVGRQRLPLRAAFRLPVPVVLVPTPGVEAPAAATRRCSETPEDHPRRFSAVGFNAARTEAIVAVRVGCGREQGVFVLLLRRGSGGWRVDRTLKAVAS